MQMHIYTQRCWHIYLSFIVLSVIHTFLSITVCACCKQTPTCWISLTLRSDTLLNVFLAIAVDNLANAQELTKVSLQCSFTFTNISIPKFISNFPKKLGSNAPLPVCSLRSHYSLPIHCLFWIFPLNVHLCRMNRRKRRPPVRRSPCRKPRRWLKSAHCLRPTSPLQREFLTLPLALLFLYPF